MPGDELDTATSAINVRRGETIANASVVALDGARRIKVANALAGPAEVVLDVLGYYLPAEQGAGDRFVSLPPARVHDAALAAEGLVPAGGDRIISLAQSVDGAAGKIVSFDEREIDFDLLVTIPVHMGADFVGRSGLGDDLNFVPVDQYTLLSKAHDNIFAVGDASDIPASKAGSVAHFAMDLFPDNFIAHVEGRPMPNAFDGHANCFIESGHGKGMLIDFNYTTEPLTGKYPLPGIGPFSLLKETELNHWGKLMFRWMYWNILLPGKELPLPALMSMAGKDTGDL